MLFFHFQFVINQFFVIPINLGGSFGVYATIRSVFLIGFYFAIPTTKGTKGITPAATKNRNIMTPMSNVAEA